MKNLIKKIRKGIGGLIVLGGLTFVSLSPYTDRFGSIDNCFYNWSRNITKTEFLRGYNLDTQYLYEKGRSSEEDFGISYKELEQIVSKYHGSSRGGRFKRVCWRQGLVEENEKI